MERAVATYMKLYPQDVYPQGHPNLAASQESLGMLLLLQGKPELAARIGTSCEEPATIGDRVSGP